jgi:hypothetical protein
MRVVGASFTNGKRNAVLGLTFTRSANRGGTVHKMIDTMTGCRTQSTANGDGDPHAHANTILLTGLN